MSMPGHTPADRIRVLHVDDDEGVAATTAEFLEREGIDVVRGTSVSDGLDRLADAEAIDCVVADYELPGGTGIELLAAVREERPDLPFILFTGRGSEEVASEAIAAGATDYLQKGPGEGQYDLLGNRILNAVEQYRSDRTRRRNERRFEAVFEDPKMHVGLLDPAGTVLRINRTALDAVGADQEDVVGERFWETPWWSHSEELQAKLRAWIERAAAGEYVGFDEDHRREDGDRYSVEGTIRPVTDDAGEVTSLIASARDVTERAERERHLKRERDRRAALFENAPGPVIDGEIRDGGDSHLIRDVNDAFERVFEFDAEAVVGRDVADVVVPDGDRGDHTEFRDRAAAGETIEAQVERITADGSRKFHLTIIPYGATDGSADGWYAWYTDVTERTERARRITALHTATRRLMAADTEREVAERTVRAAKNTLDFPYGVVRLLDEDDLLVPVAISDEMRTKLGGDRPSYAVGQETAGLAFAREETLIYDDVTTLDDGIERSEGDSMYVPIGEYGVMTVSGTESDDFDGADVDLAEILAAHAAVALERVEQARELQQRNERLDEFASIVAHDLRNPLNVLSGSLALAEETTDREHFRRCERAVDRMEELIDDLLTVARHGDDVEDPEPVRLPEVAETCWATVETDGATLDVEADAVVRADEGRFTQLLENLLQNAVEHGSTSSQPAADDAVEHGSTSPDSGAPRDAGGRGSTEADGTTVTVTVGDLDDGTGFYVEDDGTGIPVDERDRVFESDYSTAPDGTGFGLAIVERIVEAHGWSIEVTESDDGGARFEITGVRTEADR